MSKSQTLRALVNERLTAAAEEIFALFERTIAEYEEELCRSKNKIQNKEWLQDQVSPREKHLQTTEKDFQTVEIKEEPEEEEVKQEEEQLPVFVPDLIFVKTEEPLLFPEQCEQEPIASETRFQSQAETDRETLYRCSDAQMETEADGDLHQVQIRGRTAPNTGVGFVNEPEPETTSTVNDGDVSGAEEGAERSRHQCSICGKTFVKNRNLQRHIRVHVGERPYSCSWCMKTFTRKDALDLHTRIHTGDKRYSCPICERAFTHRGNLIAHMRVHTGEKPYKCTHCNKGYADHSTFKKHIRTHSRDAQS